MIKRLVCAAALATTVFAAAPASAGKLQLGTLDCTIDGGTGYIVTSNKGVSCVFRPHHHGPSEIYTGVISKLGVDGARRIRASSSGRFLPRPANATRATLLAAIMA